MSNAFLKPAEYYKREVNPIQQYVLQNSFYLSKMTGKDISQCKEFITNGLKKKEFKEIKDPIVKHFDRDHNGDREEAQTKLSHYISDVISTGQILVPTFTSYCQTSEQKSILVGFIDNNVKIRSKAKKEAFVAKANGDMALYTIKNNEQDNRKRYNNSLSGAFAAGGSIVNNPTGHNTLTSVIRTVSSLGNASNEKIIAGNRHYRNCDIILDNLICITSNIDKKELSEVLNKYQLKELTDQDVIDCIEYSSDLYFKDPKAFLKVKSFIEKLDHIEKAGFVYGSDLYHIRKYNPEFMETFLGKLSKKITNTKVDNVFDVLKKADELIVNYAHQVCMEEVRGIGKDYTKLSEDNIHTVAATCLNIEKVVEEYRDFINALFLTSNIPSSTAFIPNMVRRSVVLSDTDSTMFSVDEWVTYKYGDLVYTQEAYAYAGAVMFIATQCIAHALAIFSANMNVEREKLFVLAMKPEYVFPVFAQTSVAKHYFTCIMVKEGNVYKELDMEIKGVYLKNSAAPPEVIKSAQEQMKNVLATVMNGEKLELVPMIKRVADLERKIQASLLNGDTNYYKQSTIKNKEAYAREPEQSPYLHHYLWTDVFEPKYGQIEPVPYRVIKIPTNIENKTDLANWVQSIQDQELRERLEGWIIKYKKTTLGTIYVSSSYIQSYGIPLEIKPIINMKRIILELTVQDRMVLETLGYFPKSEWLISEQGY